MLSSVRSHDGSSGCMAGSAITRAGPPATARAAATHSVRAGTGSSVREQVPTEAASGSDAPL
ncbi:hypothetical protein GCM10010121_073750 [Streptomyces brasiliensis]|uniref:Uncharacterized protein n=1 Tax=Streptomyces brasiliensis TaxID=1954 RepID=A0A917P3A6_9ACTN|nr:hypothetical protein GCM10010121_073750 [Streptomyces brasiliensis]